MSIAKRTINGDIYRVDRPWWDSRENWSPPEDCREMLDLATYAFPEDSGGKGASNPAPCSRTASSQAPPDYKEPTLAYTKARASAESRDRLQDKLLSLSNRECDEHHAAIVGTNAGTNFGLATLTSLFSGAATGFGAESTKTALAAISSFFGATRSHLNETIYRQLFVGTILKAINDDRQSALLSIHDKRRYPVPEKVTQDPRLTGNVITSTVDAKPTTERIAETIPAPVIPAPVPPPNAPASIAPREAASQAPRLHYGIDEAIRDSEDYHDRCSFYQGLVRVSVTVQQASPCETARQRRDQVLAELSAIRAAEPTKTDAQSAFRDKIAALLKDAETLNAKMQTCIQNGQ